MTLGLRQSTPICVLLSKACEPPMKLRFDMLTSRYIYKCLSRRFSLVVRSLRRLEIAFWGAPNSKRAQLLKKIPTFKTYILQKHVLDSLHQTVVPPFYSYDYQTFIPLPDFYSFNYTILRGEHPEVMISHKILSRTELLKKFQNFSSPLIGEGISIYTDGSKSDDYPVGAAIYSSELGLALKHKLPGDTSIFSAEA